MFRLPSGRRISGLLVTGCGLRVLKIGSVKIVLVIVIEKGNFPQHHSVRSRGQEQARYEPENELIPIRSAICLLTPDTYIRLNEIEHRIANTK